MLNIIKNAKSVQGKPKRRNITQNKTHVPDPEVIELSPEDLLSEKTYSCDACNERFSHKSKLDLHLRRSHSIASSKRHVQYHRYLKYICPVRGCDRHVNPMNDINSIKKHYKRLHGPKTLKCSFCEFIYAEKADLKRHKKLMHETESQHLDHAKTLPRNEENNLEVGLAPQSNRPCPPPLTRAERLFLAGELKVKFTDVLLYGLPSSPMDGEDDATRDGHFSHDVQLGNEMTHMNQNPYMNKEMPFYNFQDRIPSGNN